ncbi:MAG: hypothetical protein HY000_36320 [Planctomycetes bacterium]|nr:hypothetical protein [Planctomycetia bacterium]MBI3468500.1 hypothetical protein [Planctomycetota bacterium]
MVPFTQRVFDVPAHSVLEWVTIVALALTPVTVIEVFNWPKRGSSGRMGNSDPENPKPPHTGS